MTDVEALVDAVRAEPSRRDELVALLGERHAIYAEQRAVTVVQKRGWVMAAFEHVGLPSAAIPFIVEELANGRDPYLLAAAAKAVRGASRPPDVRAHIDAALERVRLFDDALSFDRYAAVGATTTASDELRTTLRWLDDRSADDCCVPHDLGKRSLRRKTSDRLAVEVEDQDGRTFDLRAHLIGRPTVVAFFYTRCDNPQKCSLTIQKLGDLQRRVRAAGLDVNIIAASYDASFDTPARLAAYARQRGFAPDERARVVRCTTGFDALSDFFELGVSRAGALVTRHRVELFVIDARGRLAIAFTRLEWDPAEVLSSLLGLVAGGVVRRTLSSALAVAPAVGIALLPKCPFCWAAWLNALGIAVLEDIPYAIITPLLAAMLLLAVWLAWRRGRVRGSHVGTAFTIASAIAVLGFGVALELPHAPEVGIGLGILGAVVGSLGPRRAIQSAKHGSLAELR